MISELICTHHPIDPSIAQVSSIASICPRAVMSSPPSSFGRVWRYSPASAITFETQSGRRRSCCASFPPSVSASLMFAIRSDIGVFWSSVLLSMISCRTIAAFSCVRLASGILPEAAALVAPPLFWLTLMR